MSADLEKFKAMILKSFHETAFTVQERIVERTPIDTGRAKASWNVTENEASEETAPALRDVINPSTGAVIERAQKGAEPLTAEQALAAARTQQQNISPEALVIVISNNLPYIEALENGSSKQAPAGMVAVSTDQYAVQQILDDRLAANAI